MVGDLCPSIYHMHLHNCIISISTLPLYMWYVYICIHTHTHVCHYYISLCMSCIPFCIPLNPGCLGACPSSFQPVSGEPWWKNTIDDFDDFPYEIHQMLSPWNMGDRDHFPGRTSPSDGPNLAPIKNSPLCQMEVAWPWGYPNSWLWLFEGKNM